MNTKVVWTRTTRIIVEKWVLLYSVTLKLNSSSTYSPRQAVCFTKATMAPSPRRDFVWPYYHTGEEGSVCDVLRQCSQHVHQMSFTHQATVLLKLVKMLEYCSIVIEQSLVYQQSSQNTYEQVGKLYFITKTGYSVGYQHQAFTKLNRCKYERTNKQTLSKST